MKEEFDSSLQKGLGTSSLAAGQGGRESVLEESTDDTGIAQEKTEWEAEGRKQRQRLQTQGPRTNPPSSSEIWFSFTRSPFGTWSCA